MGSAYSGDAGKYVLDLTGRWDALQLGERLFLSKGEDALTSGVDSIV
jgi:hypothetical protein